MKNQEIRAFSSKGRGNALHAVSFVAALMASTAAMAQAPAATPAKASATPADKDEAAGDDVVVTGIRGAIIQGLENKRQSDVIVESIKSEDIGKFPDKNLAEALQRVPGISIDRDGGEGRFITIRGLGPDFNTVLLNGRRIASENYNRSFSFDTIASDMVGGVNVYKSQQSYIREGGVGGTVDVRTARPMDQKGFRMGVRLEGLYEENSGKVTPNGSVLISNTFFDDTFGILLSASRQERRNRTYQVNTGEIRSDGAFTVNDPVGAPDIFAYNNFGVEPVYRQLETNRNLIDEHRVRTGFNGAVQWKPTDQLEVNVDYLYSDFETDGTVNTVSNWLYAVTPPKSAADAINAFAADPANSIPVAQRADYARFAEYVRNNSRTVVDENGVLTGIGVNPGAGSQAFNRVETHRPTVTQMLGGNVNYKFSDTVTLKLDGAYSSAKQKNPGLDRRRSIETKAAGNFFVDASGAVPEVLDLDPRLNASYDNAEFLLVRRQWNIGDNIDAKNYELSAELNWEVNDSFKTRFGFLREVGKKMRDRYETSDNLQQRLYLNSSYSFRNQDELRSVTTGILSPDASKYGQSGDANNNTFLIDIDAYDRYMADPKNVAALRALILARPESDNRTQRLQAIDEFIANGSSFAAVRTGQSSRVTEIVSSAYFDVDGDFELFGLPSHVTAGMRYTHTKVAAAGFARVLQILRRPVAQPGEPLPEPTALEGFFAPPTGPGGLTPLTLRSSYDNFLPSMNAKTELTDDLILRVAASQTLTRPELDDLRPYFGFGSFSTEGSSVSTNNENLKPIVSTNMDASLEWYPSAGTSLAVDVFQKNIDGLIVTQRTPGLKIGTLPTTAGDGFDPAWNNFTVSRPVNGAAVRIRGATFAWTQSFGFGGGFQANYSLVGTNRPFDPDNYDETNATLPGISNSLNLVAFFERGPVSARVAYNRRDGFLRNPSYCGGIYCSKSEPVFAKSYEQVDARLGFNVTDNIQLYAEGINLTNSSLYQNGRYDNLFVSYENFGRRFTLGASAKF